MQDSPDDRAGEVLGRAASEDAIDGSLPHADCGGERDVVDVQRRIASILQILRQSAFMLDSPPGDRRT